MIQTICPRFQFEGHGVVGGGEMARTQSTCWLARWDSRGDHRLGFRMSNSSQQASSSSRRGARRKAYLASVQVIWRRQAWRDRHCYLRLASSSTLILHALTTKKLVMHHVWTTAGLRNADMEKSCCLCIFIFKVGFRPWVACGKWNIRAYCRQMCTVHLRAKKSQLVLHIRIMPKHTVQQQLCVAWKCEHPRHKCTLQCFSLVSSMELVYRQVWRCQTKKRM